MFATLTVKDFFFLLLFLMQQYGHVQSSSWMTCVPYSYFDLLDKDGGGVEFSVPVDILSFNALSIPGGWSILYTCPPGMGGHDATFSVISCDFSASITVLFEELSELSLS